MGNDGRVGDDGGDGTTVGGTWDERESQSKEEWS